jgi:antitoxin CptB
MSELDRIRWHCRRGMLELDLALNAFLERHFHRLDRGEVDAFNQLLAYPDTDLLDFIMGRAEPENERLRGVLRLVRGA